MKHLILILSIIISFLGNTQLSKTILKGKYGDSIICYHQNNKISTIDYKSSDLHRVFTTLVYDNQGKLIRKGEHGYLHGGKGFDLRYHPNGQVSRIEESFQPDGGIQHYDVIAYYDENGVFLREEDHSLNTETHVQVKTMPKEQELQKVKIDSIDILIKNTSSYQIKVLVMNKLNDKDVQILKIRKQKEFVIARKKMIQNNRDPFAYYEVIALPTSKKKTHLNKFWSKELSNEKSSVILFVNNH